MTLEVEAQTVVCESDCLTFKSEIIRLIDEGWWLDYESVQIVGGRSEHFTVDWFAFAVMSKVEERSDTNSGVFESDGGELKRVE